MALAVLSPRPCRAAPSDTSPQLPDAAQAAEPTPPAPLLLDEVVDPLPPQRSRTEAEEDRLEALARFSAGRTLQRKEQYAQALRYYQRALRYDPASQTVAKAVVRLAIELERYDEAVRVARKMQNAEILDALQWMKLGVHLTRKEEWQQAVAMYEKAAAARKDAKPTVGDVALRLELGRLYYLLEQYDKAAENFAHTWQALENPKEFGLDENGQQGLLGRPGSTYGLIGNCLLRAGRVDEAVAAYEKAHRLDPNKGLLGYRLARVETEKGNPTEALAKLQTYFEEHLASEGMAPYELLARILEDLQKENDLVKRLEELYAVDGENVPLGYFLADAYLNAQQADKGESLYRALVKKTPTLTGYRKLVAICRQTNRPEALLDALGEAAANGVVAESLAEEGASLAEDAELVRTLVEIARKRLENDPDQLDFGPRLALALLALEAKQYETANQFFDLALQADADRAPETLITWGLAALDQAQYSTAARVFQRGVDEKILPEDNPVLYYYLSGTLEMDDRSEEALAAARKAAELDPESPRFASRVAWILYRNDRNDEARKAYHALIEKFDSDFGSAEVRQVIRETRLVLSNLAVLDDDFPQAERWLEEVLDEFPDDVAALNDLGYLWADGNVRLQRAHRMIRQAVDGDPDNVAYRDSLGWVLYRLGRIEEAVAELEKAAGGDDPDPVILDHLGDAYQAANQPQKAKDAWTRALAAFQKGENAKMAEAVQQKLSKIP
jgi:tetratricopeptide (TPR) repeat protein